MKQRNILYIGISIAIVTLVIVYVLSKQKKKKEIAKIRETIKEGIGKRGDIGDIRQILRIVNTIPTYMDTAKQLAKKIKNAKGGWGGLLDDDEDAVYNALGEKTKGQIKTIVYQLKRIYGIELHSYLQDWMSDNEYKRVYNIIKTAR